MVNGLSDNLLNAIVDDAKTEKGCGTSFIHFGGAVEDVAPTATAFPWRKAKYMVYSSCAYEGDETGDSREAAWQRLHQWKSSIRGYCRGAYVNFIDESLRDYAEQYYGENLPRLREIKAKWAPECHCVHSCDTPGTDCQCCGGVSIPQSIKV